MVYNLRKSVKKRNLLRTAAMTTCRDKLATARNSITPKFYSSDNLFMTGFHQLLKEHFKDKNLSEVSRQLNIPRSVLQDWVHEEREPSFKNLNYLKSIASFLGISLEELLGGETTNKTISSIVFEDDGRRYQVLINRIK